MCKIMLRKTDQVILLKQKQLAMLPPMIAPPTAEDLLRNIMWLQNDQDRIDFIQRKARIICYDYGDIICEEAELPRGIHLITSGMTRHEFSFTWVLSLYPVGYSQGSFPTRVHRNGALAVRNSGGGHMQQALPPADLPTFPVLS
ncbi:UNVERIFIED_CONTAM: hypothetical protein K2H54_064082 [Gekko kuhli]